NVRESGSKESVVIADAVRFGNGMGDILPEAAHGVEVGPSGYSREDECAKYWIQAGLGQGQSAEIYSGAAGDQEDNVNAPPRMAREMNLEAVGSRFQRVYVSFHSNANDGKTRGCRALYNDNWRFPGTGTAHQKRCAQLIGTEVNELLKGLSFPRGCGSW